MLHKTFLTLDMRKIKRARLGLTTVVASGHALGLNQCLTFGGADVHRLASLFGNRTSQTRYQACQTENTQTMWSFHTYASLILPHCCKPGSVTKKLSCITIVGLTYRQRYADGSGWAQEWYWTGTSRPSKMWHPLYQPVWSGNVSHLDFSHHLPCRKIRAAVMPGGEKPK